MCQVLVDIPSEVLYDTRMDCETATSFAKQMVALGYYVRNNVSIGYCAEIAGMTEEEFIVFLGQNKISLYDNLTQQELMKDIQNA